jgi:hypothetical protein
MNWLSVEGLDDQALVDHAIARGLVRTRTGRILVLVSWPGRGQRRGRYCRLETQVGTRFTARCSEIAEIDTDRDAHSASHEQERNMDD